MSNGREESINHKYSQVREIIYPIRPSIDSNLLHNQAQISSTDSNGTVNTENQSLSNSNINSNDSISNISVDNTANQTSEFSNNSTSSSSSIIFKNNQRTKLTMQDVRLILYLIVQIKPFKYVGDRSLSQTKKWELIQNKYAEIKRKDSLNNELVVPTVRTLQRQLATAVKKAKLKREERRLNGILEVDNESSIVLKYITRDSPICDLEIALLELNELSEKLKTGKASNAPSNIEVSNTGLISSLGSTKEQNIFSPNTKLSDNDTITITYDSNISTPISTSHLIPSNRHTSSIQKLSNTRSKINTVLNPDNVSSDNRIDHLIRLLQVLVEQTCEFQQIQSSENIRIIEQTEKLIKQHQEHCERLIESNNQFQIEQNNLNKRLVSDIINNFSSKENGTEVNNSFNSGNDNHNNSSSSNGISSVTNLLKSLQDPLEK